MEGPPECHREVLAINLVLEQTTIPVPRIYRVEVDPRTTCMGYLVMDYIHGERLDHAWPSLSIWSKLHIAWILRSYVRQLRKIKHPCSSVPGPLGLTPQRCPGLVISSIVDSGPFADAAAFNDYINNQFRCKNGESVPDQYREPEPLVFTHNDINMRNVILGRDGLVWLIDWDFSGFYPRFFEFAAMKMLADFFGCPAAPISWRRCIPFIADPYFKRYRWIFGYH